MKGPEDDREARPEDAEASLPRGGSVLLTGAGFACLGLAFAGVFLPVLPTTPLVILAAACFARSSPRLHARLLADPIFGPVLREWQEHRAIPRKVKWISTSLIVVCGAFSMIVGLSVAWARIALGVVLLGVVAWIWSFPDGPDTGGRA